MSQSSSDNRKDKKDKKEKKVKKDGGGALSMNNVLLGGVSSAILAPLITKYLLKMEVGQQKGIICQLMLAASVMGFTVPKEITNKMIMGLTTGALAALVIKQIK